MRRVQGSEGVRLLECVNPIKGLWRVRWDVQTTDNGTEYMEEELDHKPTAEEIRTLVTTYYNNVADEEILQGLTWQDERVWLSMANQLNYKAAYDLAVQTSGETLPMTVKLGTDDAPKYCVLKTMEELTAFYRAVVAHIQAVQAKAWKAKDAFDVSLYDE